MHDTIHNTIGENLIHSVSHAPTQGNPMTAFSKGIRAEDKAVQFFLKQGFSLLARRFKTPKGEIDLIVAKGSTLLFVEVKYRKNLTKAAMALTSFQGARLYAAAEIFLQGHSNANFLWEDIRFDLLALCPTGQVVHFPHILAQETW